MSDKKPFKAFIRVVKSLTDYNFGSENVIRENLIWANDKEHVKQILLERYHQFFPENKIYFKETKDKAQFFYIQVFPLYEHEVRLVEEGEWICDHCSQVHENKVVQRPYQSQRLFPGKLFCGEECYNLNKVNHYANIELPDDENHIRVDSPNYIYRVTEKSTGKCYIGKTRNAPFFRWWNHLTHSSSPFGIYLRSTSLCDWTFDVIETLPANTPDSEVFRIESEHIRFHNSIENGYNSVISNKQILQAP